MTKQRLELDWIGKDENIVLEPRVLMGDEGGLYSFSKNDNILIQGDNLLSLKALESHLSGKVKCIFIDPPYNTGSAFEHYDDGLEHSIWLSMMKQRLVHLRKLLSDDGSIWISLDENEAAYCRVLCDEVFGRKNFVTTVAWHKRVSPANDSKWFSSDHDQIIVFAKNKEIWRPNRLKKSAEQLNNYKNPDNDPRGPWNSSAYTCAKTADERPNLYYPVTNPHTKKEIWPNRNRVWAYDVNTHRENEKNGLIYWGKDGKGSMPRIKKFLTETKDVVPRSIWSYEDAGHNQEAKLESAALFGSKPFSTPKPERLIKRVLEIATNEGDLVLDSFAGSGTTGAVAHKMNRRWIMVETGDHAKTHIIPRLQKVISGKDGLKLSQDLAWKGGGTFKFLRLAPSVLQKDDRGNWVISRNYNPSMLAAAVCKHEGFNFSPDPKIYWKQGSSTEKDFIFVTTQFLTAEHLQRINDQLKADETLLICAKAFKVPANKFDRITLKKIPQSLLTRGVEFGRDDYSLNIKEPIQEEMDMDVEM